MVLVQHLFLVRSHFGLLFYGKLLTSCKDPHCHSNTTSPYSSCMTPLDIFSHLQAALRSIPPFCIHPYRSYLAATIRCNSKVRLLQRETPVQPADRMPAYGKRNVLDIFTQKQDVALTASILIAFVKGYLTAKDSLSSGGSAFHRIMHSSSLQGGDMLNVNLWLQKKTAVWTKLNPSMQGIGAVSIYGRFADEATREPFDRPCLLATAKPEPDKYVKDTKRPRLQGADLLMIQSLAESSLLPRSRLGSMVR